MKKFNLIAAVMLTSLPLLNAADGLGENILNWVYTNFFLVLALIVISVVLVTFFRLLINMLSFERRRMQGEDGSIETPSDDTWLDTMYKKAWSLVPVQDESKIDLGHDYDGIRELDNKLPPWWLALFYGCIAFAGIYMYIYHWSGSDWSSQKEWQEEVAVGDKLKREYLAKMANLVNEETVELLEDEAAIAEGKKIFQTLCIACHGTMGEGNSIGPNLTDEHWLHGGGVKNVFRTIKYGVPEKGMISWKDQIKPGAMQKIASYIISLQGSNPPNGKAPQGEIWKG